MSARAGPLRSRLLAAWVTGLVLLAALVLVVGHATEERRLAELLARARPAWLGVAVLLQWTTYVCAAGVWQRALRRQGFVRRVRDLCPSAWRSSSPTRPSRRRG